LVLFGPHILSHRKIKQGKSYPTTQLSIPQNRISCPTLWDIVIRQTKEDCLVDQIKEIQDLNKMFKKSKLEESDNGFSLEFDGKLNELKTYF
jgi:hypothetical protein